MKTGSTVLVVVGLVVVLTIAWFYMSSKKSEKSISPSANASDLPRRPSKPLRGPQWTERGGWAVPFSVRYSYAFATKDGKVGPVSAWSPYWTSTQWSAPLLWGFEQCSKADFILLYRDMDGDQPKLVATLPMGTKTWVDKTPDM